MKTTVLRLTPRAHRDIEDCVGFVARFPRGKPERRRREIYAALQSLCEFPERHAIQVRRSRPGLELRRHDAAQFTIVYAYLAATAARPWGVVAVRAIRHRRVRDAFLGVRETAAAATNSATADADSQRPAVLLR
jgi:plasmid stabilization system protein ParE